MTDSTDPIDLTELPARVADRARTILAALAAGEAWSKFKGKRMRHDRKVISVPIGRRYRLLLRIEDGVLQPLSCTSHEQYNCTRPGAR